MRQALVKIVKSADRALLLSLTHACGRIRTRDQLVLNVAERDFEVFERSIVRTSSLRRRLGDEAGAPR